jgi:hypothetical protein
MEAPTLWIPQENEWPFSDEPRCVSEGVERRIRTKPNTTSVEAEDADVDALLPQGRSDEFSRRYPFQALATLLLTSSGRSAA